MCAECAGKIQLRETQFCPVCWHESAFGKTCAACHSRSTLAGLRVAASYEQNPILARVIEQLKYKFSEPLADTLAESLAHVIREVNYDRERIVTFVPLHAQRERWRGFNQAELLARAVAKQLNLPLAPLLTRTRNTLQQAKLKRAERLTNLTDAFTLASDSSLAEKTIILVDDVASTGATLIECAQVLRHARAAEVWGLVVARG